MYGTYGEKAMEINVNNNKTTAMEKQCSLF